MSPDVLLPGADLAVIAQSGKALIRWTPTTFYAAAAVIHTAVIWLGYRMLGLEAEYNTVTAALASATVANVAAFFLKDFGIVGVIGTGAAFVTMLLLTSGMDIFRTLMVFALTMMVYGGMGNFIAQRTPLNAYDMGGVPKVIMTGGFQPEPIRQEWNEEGRVVPSERQ